MLELHTEKEREMQAKKENDLQKNNYRQGIHKKMQEMEQDRKEGLKTKITTNDKLATDYRKQAEMDTKLKLEYDRLRRKEKEDSVHRAEMMDQYDRELAQRRILEQKNLERKLKEEADEIENYKKQLRQHS